MPENWSPVQPWWEDYGEGTYDPHRMNALGPGSTSCSREIRTVSASGQRLGIYRGGTLKRDQRFAPGRVALR